MISNIPKSYAFITSLGADTYYYGNLINGNLRNLTGRRFLMSTVYIYSLLTMKLPLMSCCQQTVQELSLLPELCWYSRNAYQMLGTMYYLSNTSRGVRNMSGCVSPWNLTSTFLEKQIFMCSLPHHLTFLTEAVSPCINELLIIAE